MKQDQHQTNIKYFGVPTFGLQITIVIVYNQCQINSIFIEGSTGTNKQRGQQECANSVCTKLIHQRRTRNFLPPW